MSRARQASDRSATLVVLYDADCGLCAWLVLALVRWDRRRRLRPVAIQGEEGQQLLAPIDPQLRMRSWHAVDADGEISSGGAALEPLLRRLPGGRPLAAIAARLPLASEGAYRWVADHRELLARALPAEVRARARARLQALGKASPPRGRC